MRAGQNSSLTTHRRRRPVRRWAGISFASHGLKWVSGHLHGLKWVSVSHAALLTRLRRVRCVGRVQSTRRWVQPSAMADRKGTGWNTAAVGGSRGDWGS